MQQVKVWDLFVRVFHWSLVTLFMLNSFVLDEDGIWHEYAGYAIAILLILRIFWGLVGSKYARFSSFLPSISASKEQMKDILRFKGSSHLGHTPLGALMIYNLIFSIGLACVFGVMMGIGGMDKVKWVEEAHEIFANWALISVFVHIGGVVVESVLSRSNLVKSMITGYKSTDKDTK